MKIKTTSDLAQSINPSDPPVPLFNTIELHVPDFERTKEFYAQLGFETIWERNPEGFKGYLVMKLENNIICFWGGNENIYQQEYFSRFGSETPRGYGVEIVHMVSELTSLYAKAQASGCVVEELKLQPWKLKDFRIVDPWGFYIRFSEPHNILSDGNAVD